jgi:hypothetical protein
LRALGYVTDGRLSHSYPYRQQFGEKSRGG